MLTTGAQWLKAVSAAADSQVAPHTLNVRECQRVILKGLRFQDGTDFSQKRGLATARSQG